MRLNYFIGQFDFSKKEIEIEEKEILHKIKNVLRLKVKDKILLGDGNMNEVIVEISKIENRKISGNIVEKRKNNLEPQKEVNLFCALLKKDKFELLCQKVTEIGTRRIFPIISKRSLRLNLNFERLKKIIKEASQQSFRGYLPELNEPIEFQEAILKCKKGDLNLIFDKNGNKIDNKIFKGKNKINIFIGPVGGWEKEEIDFAKENGFLILNLGKLNLRAETAAIIAAFLSINL
ncbi:MAG: RsmE family RNA methyltransferase [candidate division WOR-3 bacterium]